MCKGGLIQEIVVSWYQSLVGEELDHARARSKLLNNS